MEKRETEMMVVFTDKNYKYSWAIDWDLEAVKKRANLKPVLVKKFWEQDKLRAYSGLAENFPSNWKSFKAFRKAHEKWYYDKVKEQDERAKKGLGAMSQKQWNKGMPKFKPKLKTSDVRIVIVTKDCKVWLLPFEEATYERFKLIIKSYKT